MKNLQLLVVLVVSTFMFQACSDDDENNGSIEEADLIGTWTSSEIEVSFLADGESVQINNQNVDVQEETTFDFKADKTYTEDAGTAEEQNGTWSLNSDGSVITLDPENGTTSNYDVLSGSSSQLKLQAEEDLTALAALFGVEAEEEFISVVTITLTK